MRKHDKRQYQPDVDSAERFSVCRYSSVGYGMHFHRNVEIYGVIKGSVRVKIAGEERILTDGQMAIVNCMELHGYTANEEAEVVYMHVGTGYLTSFYSIYQGRFLPRWLTNPTDNEKLYAQILSANEAGENPLRRQGVICRLLADIVESYGFGEKRKEDASYGVVERVVQYVYEHHTEEITLRKLADVFCIESKTLSKKLARCIGVDLRVFVNDVRAQRAIQMRQDARYKDLSLKEIGRLCGFKTQDTFYRVYKRNLEY